MGLAGHRRFLLVASAGFDAKVTEEVKKTRTDTLGYAGYVFPVLKALASHEAQELYVRIDDGEVVAGYQAMVLKVSRYGGLFSFAQEARLDSGLFSVCVIQEAAIMSWGLFAVAGLLGTASHCPGVVHRTARRVFIESSDPVPVEIDGDYFGMTPIGIDLQPSIVPVIVPENARDRRGD